jgi:uncharacterized protein YrrD
MNMLQLSGALLNRPVLSLRASAAIAEAIEPIINPNNLKIEGWYCQDIFDNRHLILLTQDIRDILEKGIVVNDHEVLVEPDELVRLKEVLEMNFKLLDKPVFTVSGEKLGKVSDYSVDNASYIIQKIYVSQSLLKSLSGGSLSIARNQIVEITEKKIVVQDLVEPLKANAAAATVPLSPGT